MSAYLSAVIADNPTHYWRCADQGGSFLHDVGSSPVLLRTTQISTDAVGYSGPISDGGSVDLTLNATYAQSGTNVPFPGGHVSLELLFWPFQKHSTIQLFEWLSGANQVSLQKQNTDVVTMIYNGVGVVGVHAMAFNAWHHVVGTYDGANARIYLDGALENTGAVANQAAAASQAWLSTNSAQSDFAEGFFAEVALYATTLSAARVSAHFNAIDRIANVPVYGASGGLGGSGVSITDPAYLSILQQILQSVRKTF